MKRRFEAALSDCLAALDRGEPLAVVLQAYPEFESELRASLALRTQLSASSQPVPVGARLRGEAALRAARQLESESSATARRWIRPGTVVRLALAMMTLSIGAASASAAVGGEGLPPPVAGIVSAIREGAAALWADAGPDAPADSEPTETAAEAGGTPEATSRIDSDLRGLCIAFLAGGVGRDGTGSATSFERLAAAAEAPPGDSGHEAVAAYCTSVVGVSAGGPDPGRSAPGPSGSVRKDDARTGPPESAAGGEGAQGDVPRESKPEPQDSAPGNSRNARADAPGQLAGPGRSEEAPGKQAGSPGPTSESPGQQGGSQAQQHAPAGNDSHAPNGQGGANNAEGNKGNGDQPKGGAH